MIRYRAPNKFKARSIIKAAEMDINYIKTLRISEQSTSTLIRGVYENFRMLGEALLIIHGKEVHGADSHTETIAELLALNVKTIRPLGVLSNLKDLRHDINYQGYIPSVDEAKDAISIVNSCFSFIATAIKIELNKL